MPNTIPVGCIEDDNGVHQGLLELFNDLPPDLVAESVILKTELCPSPSDQLVCDWMSKCYCNIMSHTGRLILFIDLELQFRKKGPGLRKAVQDWVVDILEGQGKDKALDLMKDGFLGQQLDGFCAAIHALENTAIDELLLILSTNSFNARYHALDVLQALAEVIRGDNTCRVELSATGRGLNESGRDVLLINIRGALSSFKDHFVKVHNDKLISEAIRFYGTPWLKAWKTARWDHDLLNEKNRQFKVFSDWLGFNSPDDIWGGDNERKGASAKHALMWRTKDNFPWQPIGDKAHRSGRYMQGKVIKKLFSKLGISLTVVVHREGLANGKGPLEESRMVDDENDWFLLPCDPCFPFVVSIRSFLWSLEKNPGRPAEEVILDCYVTCDLKKQDLYFLTARLNRQTKAWGLRDKYFNFISCVDQEDPSEKDRMLRSSCFETREEEMRGITNLPVPVLKEDQNRVSHALLKTTYGMTAGFDESVYEDISRIKRDEPYKILFIEGPGWPIVSLEFGPHHVSWFWSARKLERGDHIPGNTQRDEG